MSVLLFPPLPTPPHPIHSIFRAIAQIVYGDEEMWDDVRGEMARELRNAAWLYEDNGDGTFTPIGPDFRRIDPRPDINSPSTDEPSPLDPRLPVPDEDGYITYEQYADDMEHCVGLGGHWGQAEELWLASRRYGMNFVSIAELPLTIQEGQPQAGYTVELFPARAYDQMNLVPMTHQEYAQHQAECARDGVDPIAQV